MHVCAVCVRRVRACADVGVCPCVTHASTRLLRVGKDTYSTSTVSTFLSSYIPERCLHFNPLTGTASFCSTPSLAGRQQQQQLHLHQQECGTAAAGPTARIRRVQQPMLHVSSNRSCDYFACVSLFSICVTAGISHDPHPEGRPCTYMPNYSN